MKGLHCALWVVLALTLAGCSDEEVILTGNRIDVRETLGGEPFVFREEEGAETEVNRAFAMPATVANAAWTHTAGGPTHRIDHPALNASLQRVWSTNIGAGNSRKHRITSDPIVAEGRIFTVDSRAKVSATGTNGAALWTTDLTPATDREGDASGGGVAFGEGRVIATTGFGEVVALDPATGGILWRQRLDAPATSSPTVKDGLVYAISRDNRAWAIDVSDGRVQWQLPGTPSVSGISGGAGPAVTDTVAIFPFASGELVAALRQGGVRVWGATVSGSRRGRAYANVTDIVADPVVVDDIIYTGNQSGRAVAISLNSGTRLWTANDGAYGPVWVAGGSVFLVSDEAELVRLDAETGTEIWSTELPYFKRANIRRRDAVFAHYGPVLAGGRLWVASDDGNLRSFDPETGALTGSTDIPGGAASNMAVAGGTLYVISDNGQLHAFR